MRSLIDEYGHLVIALFLSSFLIVNAIFGVFLPQLKTHAQDFVPQDSATVPTDYLALTANAARPSPAIIVPELEIDYCVYLDFDDCIFWEKSIRATNADGEDLSSKIRIEPANEETAQFYDPIRRRFGGDDLYGGEYKFILSVMDYTEDEHFGKETKKAVIVTVTEDEE